MEQLNVNCPCGSAKKFMECHGAPKNPLIAAPPPAKIELAKPSVIRKLDLAAGQSPREGFEGVDVWPGSQHVVDLTVYPWPFDDNSVAELHSSHYIEHIAMEYVDEFGNPVRRGGKDALFKFFDECYRILVPGGTMQVICPANRSDRAFQDPTHRRFIPQSFFGYLLKEWRVLNKLDHYNVECDFAGNVGHSMSIESQALHQEVINRKFNESWNFVMDWIVVLYSRKGMPAGMPVTIPAAQLPGPPKQ